MAVWQAKTHRPHPLSPFLQKPFQKKRQKVGYRIKRSVEAEVFIGEFYPVPDIGKLVVADHGAKGRRLVIVGFYFNRNERVCVADKEINYKSSAIVSVKTEIIADNYGEY